MSLKRKIQYVYTISSAVVAFALVLGILLSIKGMSMLTDTLDNNDKALKLYKAVTKERNALKLYFEDEQAELPEQIDEVRNNTKDILGQIPADYSYMNEEQYIIIQSIHNIYDSYDNIYNSIVNSNLNDKDYRSAIDNCYKVQNYLEDYAKRYESITVSLGNEQYNSQKKLFYIIPVICIIIAFVVIILSIWIRLFMNRSIVKPILKLSDEARRISVNDYSGDDIIIEGDDEISLLIKEFTQMKHSTKNYIVTLKEKHKVEQQLEHMRFEMLKNQINPHFLYNTLDSIIWMSEAGRNDEVVLMTSALARLFRQSISNDKEQVTIAEEIEYVRSYLTIQKMRYKDKLEYSIDVSPEINHVMIIKFALQPLVENAIYHGLKYKETKGNLSIRGYVRGKKAYITIADDGVGMEEAALEHIFDETKKEHKSNGVGVPNVQKRLKLYYGQEYGISYISRKGVGTVATVTVPLEEQEDDEETHR